LFFFTTSDFFGKTYLLEKLKILLCCLWFSTIICNLCCRYFCLFI